MLHERFLQQRKLPRLERLVELRGIEPLTSAVRLRDFGQLLVALHGFVQPTEAI